jgi:hypothetical protein
MKIVGLKFKTLHIKIGREELLLKINYCLRNSKIFRFRKNKRLNLN